MKRNTGANIGVSVLAGGRSSRMGRDKARLRLGTRTMLGEIRATVKALGLPLRIIRHDLLPGCGPIGGIYTALKTSRSDAELFLACDMPFVSEALISRLLKQFQTRRAPLFATGDKEAGFPFVLPQTSLGSVEAQLRKREFSLQALAGILQARLMRLPGEQTRELFNVNTPEEFQEAGRQWERISQLKRKIRRTPREREKRRNRGLSIGR